MNSFLRSRLTATMACLSIWGMSLAADDPAPGSQQVMVFAHQDDDVLWMLPFWSETSRFVLAAVPTTPAHQRVVAQHPAPYPSRWVAAWGKISNQAFSEIYTSGPTSAEAKAISTDSYLPNHIVDPSAAVAAVVTRIRPYVDLPEVGSVVTHNPWGEYGHIHHKLVSRAVRQLAVSGGKDVWVLGTRVGSGQYRDVNLGASDIVVQRRSFDGPLLTSIRRLYESTPNSPNVWTWGADYPTGERPFFKIVAKGRDLATSAYLRRGVEALSGQLLPARFRPMGNLGLVRVMPLTQQVAYTEDFLQWQTIAGPVDQVVVGDFNGDGVLDLAGVNLKDSTIWVSTDRTSFHQIPGQADQMAVTDLNGDGRQDLIAVNWATRAVFYTTDMNTWIPFPRRLDWVMAGDFNKDGRGDIAGVDYRDQSIWYSTDLVSARSYPGKFDHFVVADFNKDGLPDVAGLNYAARSAWINTGSGWTRVEGKVDTLMTGDFDGDGAADLIGLNTDDDSIWISMDRAAFHQIPGIADRLVVMDINGDGKDELVGMHPCDSSIWYTLNRNDWNRVAPAEPQPCRLQSESGRIQSAWKRMILIKKKALKWLRKAANHD